IGRRLIRRPRNAICPFLACDARPDPALSLVHLAVARSALPAPAELLRLRDGGNRASWRLEGRVARALGVEPVPSIRYAWVRPGAADPPRGAMVQALGVRALVLVGRIARDGREKNEMIKVTLPDGSVRELAEPMDGRAFAESIAKSLAKKAIALKVDGKVKDLATMIDRDAIVEVVTPTTPDGLEILRHDCAHVMAEAVQELFPGTQVTIGPVIENGFFYDFARAEPFKAEDLEKIEAKMREKIGRASCRERG